MKLVFTEHVFHSSFKLSRQSLLSSRSMLKIRHCLPVNLSPSRYHVDVDLMSSSWLTCIYIYKPYY
ncbi:hypothetical protein HanIR_Chr03g0123271 [Helianthus annuus]|nr:hypothetical protein HanIR_Chr03g0123271 [Helianthus annuus]